MIQLKHIKLGNFKCFSNELDLELGKLTLLTGANSTGKSSLMYGVLGALQSPRFPYEFSANGRYVNMGNFSEMVFDHEKTLPMTIGFTLVENNTPIEIKTIWINSDVSEQAILKEYEAHSLGFDFSVRRKEGGENTDFLLSMDYRPQNGQNHDIHGLELLLTDIYRTAELFKIFQKGDNLADEFMAGYKDQTTVNDVLLKVGDSGVICPDNLKATVAFGLVNRKIIDLTRRYQEKMNFISSYRLPGERTYLEESLENGKIHTSGKGFVNQLLQWRENNRQYYESLIDVMRSMGILYDIEPERIGSGQFKIGVTIRKDGPTALLTDVGFGISQLLPVIVGDIELGNESTFFAAQPEIHLHPNAQASYADYLIGQIKQDKNYVVETHSEYLLNRIRLAIVKGNLKEEDIRVYYLSQERNDSKIHPIRFTRGGQIIGAPKDFFETYMIDVMDIAMEAIDNEA
jgi:predicted ATPase